MALPSSEDVNNYQIGEAITEASKDLSRSEDPYLENDMELKSLLLTLQAKDLNPMFNKVDIALGTIKDPKKIKELEYYINFGIELYELGLLKSARLCASWVLTNLNFRRSEGGAQQEYLITRVKAQQLGLQKKEGFRDRILK